MPSAADFSFGETEARALQMQNPGDLASAFDGFLVSHPINDR